MTTESAARVPLLSTADRRRLGRRAQWLAGASVAYNAVEVFANAIYGGKHDRGEDGMPKREFMYFSDRGKERMAEIIADLAFGGK